MEKIFLNKNSTQLLINSDRSLVTRSFYSYIPPVIYGILYVYVKSKQQSISPAPWSTIEVKRR